MIENGFHILNRISANYSTRIASRITGNNHSTSKTIIDHILTNMGEYEYKLHLNDNPLSDHREIKLNISKSNSINFTHEEVSTNIAKINFNSYNEQLTNILCGIPDSLSYPQLINSLLECRNNNIQIKTFTTRSNPHKPWINDEFFTLLKQREKYFKLLKKSPTNEYLISKYKLIFLSIRAMKLQLKSNYYSTKINGLLGKPKLAWREINNAIYNKANKPNTVNAIKLGNSHISYPKSHYI